MNIVPSSSSMNSNRKEAATLSACVRFGTVADLHAYFDISNSSLAVDVDELQRALVWAIQYRTFSVVKFLTEIFRGIFESKRLSYSSILPDASYDPLVISLRCARWQVFDLLLNQGFDLLSSLEKLSEREVGRALQEVCLSGSLSRIEAFLQAGVSTEALCNANGDTALMVAVATDAPAPAIELLLRYGANPNAVNAVGKSVLRFWACSSRASDKEKILHILLSAGADFGHADAKWTHGSVLFDLADSWRPSHPPSIVSRLRRLGIDLHSRRSSGTSVLMVAARNPYSLTLLKTLVASGAPLNLQDRLGWTALMHAIDAGVKDSCLILIKSGCDVALRNQADMDALAMLNVRNHWTLWGVEDRLERALEKSKQKALRIPQVNVPQSTVGPASEKRMCDVIDVPQEDGYAESETSETEDASEEIEDNSQGMGNFSDPESVSESSSSDSEEDVAGIVSTPATRQSRSGRRVSFSSIVEVDTADTSSHLEGNSLKKKLYVLEEENLQLFALVQKLQQQLAASPGTNAVTPFSPAPGAWQADCLVSDDALRTAHLDDSTNPFCSPLLASPTSMLDTFAHVEHFSSFGDTSLRSIRDENLAMAGELHEKNAVLESIIHFLTESLGQSVNMADLPQVVRSLATDLKDTAHSLDAVRSELATESKAAADLEVRLQQATLEGNQSSAPAAAGFDVARENGPFTESQVALTNQVADLETILDAVRRELAAESACVADLDCQLRAALAGNAKLESDISVLLCQLSDARDACDRQTDELQKELRRTAEECATAKLNESILATRWSEQCAVLAAVQSELQSRSSQCADLQESLDTTTAEKELLASRLEMSLRESSEKEIAAETKSKAMTQELMLRNCELTSLRSAVADKQYALEVESEKFALVIAESENQQSLLREQVEELEDEIRAMRAQLTDAAAADAERELKLTNTESAISSMNLLVCSLQEQVEKLEMELVSKCANLSAVASEADVKAKQSSELLLERDDTIANLRSQLAELQAKAEIAAVQASHLLVESEHKWKLEVERQNALVADLQSKLATVQVAVTVEREEGSYRLSDLRFQVADQQQALTERDDTIAALRLEVETALHALGLKSVSESAATARILELEIMTEKLQSELETTRGVCAAHLGTVSDVSKAESTISVLQCDVAKRDRQIIDLLEQLKSVTEASQAELSSAHSDLSAARQQVLTLEERLLACDAGMDDLRHLINSSDATASAREHHHAVIVGQLQENVHALETQVADLRIAAHSAEHSLAAELQHAQHTIHELEKKIVLQEQELSKRDRHIFGLCEQFDEAVSALHSERSRNDVAANDMLRQVTELRTHLEERDRCILDLESQLDSLKVTNQSQQDGGVLPAMFEALNAELEAAQVALRVAEESLGTVSAERDILMQQLSRMATKLAEIHETKVSTARISETAGVHHNLEDDIPPVVCSAPSETNSPSYAVAPSHGLVTHLDEHSVPDQPVAVVPSVVTSDDRLLRLDHRTNEVHRLRRFYSVLSKFLVDVDDSPLRRLLDDKKFAPRVRLVGANARLSSRSSSSGETKASRLPNVWRY